MPRPAQNVYYSLPDACIIQALDLMRAVLSGILTRRQSLPQEMLENQA